MEFKQFFAICFLVGVFGLANPASSAACTVTGVTIDDAASRYVTQCDVPMVDCDPVNGQWYCSSELIDDRTVLPVEQPVSRQTVSSQLETADLPDVSGPAACIDNDGDGWGWNGVVSCRIAPMVADAERQSTDLTSPSSNTDSADNTSAAICIDDDGDGWGWDGVASCRVSVSSISSAAVQKDLYNSGTANCQGPYSPHHITDVVLVTGQSNVTGAQTSVAGTLDRWGKVVTFHEPDNSHPRVFAWTVDPHNNNAGTGWRVAALNQSWHDSAPGVGGIARNNFGFHFAKQVVAQSNCRVVGLVMVSEGGKGISHWDNNAPGWREVVQQVGEAMSAIGRTSIDGILWHQGESDWIVDGTCFTGGRCLNDQPDYYAQKLYSKIADKAIANSVGQSALLDRLRRESWFGEGKPFIAGETINVPVNVHLNKLNSDNDRWTACVESDLNSGIGIRADDPFKNHYDASGLRELGKRYAVQYLQMTGN